MQQVKSLLKEEGHDSKDNAFWADNRQSELSESEEGVFAMVDSIKEPRQSVIPGRF